MVSQKRKPIDAPVQRVGLERAAKVCFYISLHGIPPCNELGLFVMPKYQIVHISHIRLYLKVFFDIAIQPIQVMIGKILAAEVADWQPPAWTGFVTANELLKNTHYRSILEHAGQLRHQHFVVDAFKKLPNI